MAAGSRRWTSLLAACAAALAVAGPAPAAAARPAWPAGHATHLLGPVGGGARLVAPTNGSGPLAYGGGPVQAHPRVYLDFWGSAWIGATTDTGGYTGAQGRTYVQSFVEDIGSSPWFTSQLRYCDGVAVGATTCPPSAEHVGPVALAGTWLDTNTEPDATDDGVAGEADVAAAHFGLDLDVDATVVVLTPAGHSYFTSQGVPFCGYHGFTASTVYAYIPWMPDGGADCGQNLVDGSNDAFGHGHFDGFSIVLGHEIAEAATDPFPIQEAFGWVDGAGFESADKCQSLDAWPARGAAFGSGATSQFAVQPLWSNAGQSCAFEDLGGGTTMRAAVASWGAGHRDVFVRGLDGALYTRRWDGGGWSPWAWLGGRLASEPAAVSWGGGRTDVFAIGQDGAMWHIAWSGAAWSPWQSLGGGFTSGPAAASWTAGRLDVVAVGRDGSLWHSRWNGSAWTAWTWLGGALTSSPTAVSWQNGTDRVDVFARGRDGGVWQDAWTGAAWSGWLPRGGWFRGAPAVASTAPGRLRVFGIGSDGALWSQLWNGVAWSAWSSSGGSWSLDPAAVAPPGAGGTELFMVGAGGATERLVPGP